MNPPEAIEGAILCCAVGDALGLPYEGLAQRRGVRLLGKPDRHRLLLGRGMVSDDTEHTCMTAEALGLAPTDADEFARHLGRRLRWWLLGVPAGIGFATLRAIVKLWLGYPPSRSGVFSAGNGPAMRSPILGTTLDDVEKLRSFVRASTLLTHTDPKAYHGAFAVALAAWCAKRGLDTPDAFFNQHRNVAGSDASGEFLALMTRTEKSLTEGQTTADFAEQLGCGRGVSGYVYHTVPVALHCWLRHPRSYPDAVMTVIKLGGDTDTTAAIVGGIVGCGLGRKTIPHEWLDRLWEWPRSVAWMERLAKTTEQAVRMGVPQSPPRVMPLVGLARNAVFLGVVLGHLGRRLLPPY